MATRTITGTILDALGDPISGAGVSFVMNDGVYLLDPDETYMAGGVTAITNSSGVFSVDLASGLPITWSVRLPGGDSFVIAVPTGAATTLEELRAAYNGQAPERVPGDPPTVTDFTNAQHTHLAAASGGALPDAALGSGTANAFKYLRGDRTYQDAAFLPATNIKHQGALGDGSTDDTTAVESALTTAKEIAIPGEAGEVYIVDKLDGIQSNTVIRGTGRPTLKVKASSTSSPMLLSINAVSNVLIENIVFDGNTDNVVSFNNVVLVFDSDHITFRHCRFQNCEGIAAFVGGTSHHVTFEDCEFENCGQSVFLVTATSGDRKQALAFSGVEHPRVHRCTFKDVGLDCISVASGCSEAVITENTIDTNYAGGIFVSGCAGGVVANNRIIDGGGNGIDCPDSSDLTITGNSIEGCAAAGILVATLTGTVRGVTVSGNVCKNNHQGVSDHHGGITLHFSSATTMSDVALSGNVCFDDQGAGSVTQRYAIGIVDGGGSRDNIVVDESNVLIGYSAAGYPDRSSAFEVAGVLFNPERDLDLQDHFLAGASTSVVGELGWGPSVSGTGTGAIQTGEAGHPGIHERSTAATSGSVSALRLNATSGGIVDADDMFDLTYVFRLMDNDANVTMRLGLGANGSDNPPAVGIYLEKVDADTQWFGVTRTGGSQSRTAALATCDTSYHTIRMRRINSTTIGFALDGDAEVTLNTNVPTSGVTPFLSIVNSAAANKRLRVDRFRLRIAGVA